MVKKASVKASDTLKWIASGAATETDRRVLTYAYCDGERTMGANGHALHIAYEALPADEYGFIALKKSVGSTDEHMKFPPVDGIIPRTFAFGATVDSAALLQALKLADVFARDDENRVFLRFVSGTNYGMNGALSVIARSAGRGDIETAVGDVAFDTYNVTGVLAVNGDYLRNAVSGLGDRVTIRYNAPAQPIVLTNADGSRLAVVMPSFSFHHADRNEIPVVAHYDTMRANETYLAELSDWKRADYQAIIGQNRPSVSWQYQIRTGKPKKEKKVKRFEPGETVLSEITGITDEIDGMGKPYKRTLTHGRYEIRRGYEAFADLRPRLTPDVKYGFVMIELRESLRILISQRAYSDAPMIGRRSYPEAYIVLQDDHLKRHGVVIDTFADRLEIKEILVYNDGDRREYDVKTWQGAYAQRDVLKALAAVAREFGWSPKPKGGKSISSPVTPPAAPDYTEVVAQHHGYASVADLNAADTQPVAPIDTPAADPAPIYAPRYDELPVGDAYVQTKTDPTGWYARSLAQAAAHQAKLARKKEVTFA